MQHNSNTSIPGLLNFAPCGYLGFTNDGTIVHVNETLCLLMGYSKEELTGFKFQMLLTIAGRIFFQTHLFPLLELQEKAEEIFLTFLTKKGVEVPVLLNANRNPSNEVPNCCVIIPVYNRRKYEEKILVSKKQAEEAVEKNDELIKARQEAEKHAREADKQITRMNRINSELMQFNNIIHHDMQECVRKINIFSTLARTETDEDYLQKISETAARLKAINSSLHLFIRLGIHSDKFSSVDLNKVLQDCSTDVLLASGFKNLNLTSDVLPEVEGSGPQLKLLFYHILHNSVKFRKKDSVSVTVSSVIYEDNIYKNSEDKYDYREVVRIDLIDNGMGFDNKYKEYVLSILKKMEVYNSGTGIGLALCKKVVDNHHGEIAIDSKEGEGTRVIIILPVKQQ